MEQSYKLHGLSMHRCLTVLKAQTMGEQVKRRLLTQPEFLTLVNRHRRTFAGPAS
jgi:hypothetical protein